MITKTTLALVAAVALAGIASPALAQGVPVIPQFSLPSEAPGYGAAPAQQNRGTAVRSRTLYNSTVTPNDNWANDSAGSAAARGNSH
jgi:hypothetical protein